METVKNNYLIIAALFTAFFLGGVGGYYMFYRVGPIGNLCELGYVSYDEIMALEKKRLESMGATDPGKNLFYGKGKEVAAQIALITGSYNSNKVKVLLTSGTIHGNNVRSLSKEVYEEVMAELALDRAGGGK